MYTRNEAILQLYSHKKKNPRLPPRVFVLSLPVLLLPTVQPLANAAVNEA